MGRDNAYYCDIGLPNKEIICRKVLLVIIIQKVVIISSNHSP